MTALVDAVRERVRRGPSAGAPWSADQLGRVVVGNALGAVLVLVGWYQSATAAEVVRTRSTWLAVSIAGVALAGVANARWLASLRGRVALGRAVALAEVAQLLPAADPDELPAAGPVVTAPGMTRYHRPDCELARGKPTRALSERQRRAGRLQPCEVCLGADPSP